MVTAVLWAIPVLILAWCARTALRGHHGSLTCLRRTLAARTLATLLRAAIAAAPCLTWARWHLTRRRYTRRMRGPLPPRDQGIPYDQRRWLTALDAWEAPAAPHERSRT